MVSYRWLSQRLYAARALLLAVGALAVGCASPAEPTARRPIIPQTIQDLQTRQQGEAVVVSFTLPTQSTRNEPLAVAPAIEIYRGEIEAGTGGKPIDKISTKLVYTIPGEMVDSYRAEGRIVYRDGIEPGELANAASGAGAERIYVVRTRAARNRASTESNRVVVRVRPAPEAVGNVSARVAGQSVMLTWPREANADYRVYRAEIAPESAPAAVVDTAKAVVWRPLVQVAQMRAATNAEGSSLLQYQDEDVEFSHSYMYIVRRVAQFAEGAVESADSKATVITVVAVSPPAAPEDLEAVVAPASGQTTAYVSLSWAIGPEGSVAGYVVYRNEQEGTRGTRLNAELLRSPTYRDDTVSAGRQYFYSVTATDAAGQESAASGTVEAQIPAPQP